MGTIDLNAYELGTLFTYARAKEWCRDGQAEVREFFGKRYLVDTYWADFDSTLTPAEAALAVLSFVPSEHRKISAGDAEIYGEDRVVRITRQHGSYTNLFVRVDVPELTELDHYRHMLRTEEDRLVELRASTEAAVRTIERHRAHITTLEAAL